MFDSRGKVLGYYGNAFSTNSSLKGFGQRGNLRVPRNVLRKVMMDALLERDRGEGHVRIEWGRKLTSYHSHSQSQEQQCAAERNNTTCEKPIALSFEVGPTAEADLLIGADGLRSTVIQTLLSTNNNDDDKQQNMEQDEKPRNNPADLSYIGIMIVLGITREFFHPLLDERGFYTLDGDHRLFTMPFKGSRIHDLEEYDIALDDSSTNLKRSRRYMWQLSFNLNEKDAVALSKGGSQAILDEVLRRTEGWHEPVQDMMRASPLETVWGTPLMDRDPNKVLAKMQEIYNPSRGEEVRTLVLGDAVHAMSPFKGQGCNQALMDGPLLSSWIERSNLDSSVKGFMREMVQRTHKKVMASREAAKFLHSDKVLSHAESVAGVKSESVKHLLATLEERGIDAKLGGSLDSRVAKVIQELGISDEEIVDVRRNPNVEKQALDLAAIGDTAGIRKLSMSFPRVTRAARHAETGETCLHFAAKVGCYHTVKWLLSEACVDYEVLDNKKQSPLHAAVVGGNVKVVRLLTKMCKGKMECWGKNCDGATLMGLVALHKDEEHRDILRAALLQGDCLI